MSMSGEEIECQFCLGTPCECTQEEIEADLSGPGRDG